MGSTVRLDARDESRCGEVSQRNSKGGISRPVDALIYPGLRMGTFVPCCPCVYSCAFQFQERRARDTTGIDDPDREVIKEDPTYDTVWLQELNVEERLNAIKGALNRREGSEKTLSELYEEDDCHDFEDVRQLSFCPLVTDCIQGITINPLNGIYLPPHDYSFPTEIEPGEVQMDEWFHTEQFKPPEWPRPFPATPIPFSLVNDDEIDMLNEAVMEWRIEPPPRDHALEDLIDYTSMLEVNDDVFQAPKPVPPPIAPPRAAARRTRTRILYPTSSDKSMDESLAIVRRGVGKRKIKPLVGKRQNSPAMAPPRRPLPYRGRKTALVNNIVRVRDSSRFSKLKKDLPTIRTIQHPRELHLKYAVHAALNTELVEETPEPTRRPGPDPIGLKSYVFYHAMGDERGAGLSDDHFLEPEFRNLDEDIIPDLDGGCFELPATFNIVIDHYDDATELDKSTVPFSMDLAKVALRMTMEEFDMDQLNELLLPPGPFDNLYEIPPAELPGTSASVDVSQHLGEWSNNWFNAIWKPEPYDDPAFVFPPRIPPPSGSPELEDIDLTPYLIHNGSDNSFFRFRDPRLPLPTPSPQPISTPLPTAVPPVDVARLPPTPSPQSIPTPLPAAVLPVDAAQDQLEISATVPEAQEPDNLPAVPAALALLDTLADSGSSMIPASLVEDGGSQLFEFPVVQAPPEEEWMQYINWPPEPTLQLPTEIQPCALTNDDVVSMIESFLGFDPSEQPEFAYSETNTHLSPAQSGSDDTGSSSSMAQIWSSIMDTLATIPSSMSYAIDNLLGHGNSNVVEMGGSSLPLVACGPLSPIEQQSERDTSSTDGTDFTGFFVSLAELEATNDLPTFELPQDTSFYGYHFPTPW